MAWHFRLFDKSGFQFTAPGRDPNTALDIIAGGDPKIGITDAGRAFTFKVYKNRDKPGGLIVEVKIEEEHATYTEEKTFRFDVGRGFTMETFEP